MILFVAAAIGAALCSPVGSPHLAYPAPVAEADSANRAVFEGGVTISDFLAHARSRKEQWRRNYDRARVPDALVTRASVTPGGWKLLVVAADGCSDSVNTIPYVARLAERLSGIELRIVSADVGRRFMDAHKTPDGRSATPTVILLDAEYAERGCWVERPSELRDWILGNRGTLKDSEIFERKMKWYDDDAGRETMREIADMIERAVRGEPAC
jgi:hypothetical protein